MTRDRRRNVVAVTLKIAATGVGLFLLCFVFSRLMLIVASHYLSGADL